MIAWGAVLALVAVFVGALAVGVPVAFAIALATTVGMLLVVPLVPAVVTVAQRMATGLDAFTLLAIPFFVLAGELMNRGGAARRLIDLAKALTGRLPASLVHVHVTASMLFGAISGSAVAAASAIGGIMAPRMNDEGYRPGFSAAVNITAATTGLIIPPSNILIVYALASGGVSIAALFLAGYLPGLLVGLALMVVAGVSAQHHGAPRAAATPSAAVLPSLLAALPSLLLLVLVIGGIVGGVFTATEAAAVAVLYALILGLAYGEVRWRDVPGILRRAGATTAVVLLLVAASLAMSWLLAYARVPQAVAETLLAATDDRVLLLLIMNLVLLAVGTFMDMTPAVLIFTPIFLPVAQSLGMDPVHFGIVLVLNLCIGLCTPPVGSVLFVGCGVAGVRLGAVVRPLVPLYVAMILVLLLITYLPWLSLALPHALGYGP